MRRIIHFVRWRAAGLILIAVFIHSPQAALPITAGGPLMLPPNIYLQQPPAPHLGYGANVNEWDVTLLDDMGFDWIKVFNPPDWRLPQSVLIRVNATASDLNNLNVYGNSLAQTAAIHGPYVEAYEIGNEPNLDASYGWGAAPRAADYVTVLCEAFQRIKANDPESIVVSAGLAPTGRVQGNWNGHAGHNGFYQDEREFLKEFLSAGGADCADAIGYHPYGFSAGFDAPADVPSSNPDDNCANGFCFRGVEKIQEIMAQLGHGSMQVWATEFGWIVEPPQNCLNDPSWAGRLWQIVSEQEQAENLAGAYQYADANYPWMGGMFYFNLNFNKAGHLAPCEQMRFYGVEDRPAEDALRNMPKRYGNFGGELSVSPTEMIALAETGNGATTLWHTVILHNPGFAPLDYSISTQDGAWILLPQDSGSLQASETTTLLVGIRFNGQTPGVHNGEFVVTPGTGASQTVSVALQVVPQIFRQSLPMLGGG